MASLSSHLSRMPGGRQLELPFRVNVLIELGNVCFSLTLHTKFADNCHRQDALEERGTRTTERLAVLNMALVTVFTVGHRSISQQSVGLLVDR